jgi:hypothetical protein
MPTLWPVNWLEWALWTCALGWGEQVLHGRRKSAPQKVRIAARLRRETTMILEWVANRLCLGAPTHVASLLQRRNQEGGIVEELC